MENIRCFVKDEKIKNVTKVTFERDYEVNSFVEYFTDFGILTSYKGILGEKIEAGTSLYLDRNLSSLVVRFKDKRIILISSDQSLFIDSKSRRYVYKDYRVVYPSDDLAQEEKVDCFERITAFMALFKGLNDALPMDLTTKCLFAHMGLLDISRFHIIASDDNVKLCLNDFREINPIGMKLTIADAVTNEVVGYIEYMLNKKEESNFSFSGNVEYNIVEECSRKGYATSALAVLKDYIKNIDKEYSKYEEYCKDLYVATLVDDEVYQQVAIKNGGILVYEGPIPAREPLRALRKVEDIKIYRIEN